MRRAIRIALLVLVIGLVIWALWRSFSSEPTYDGKALTVWLLQHDEASNAGDKRAKDQAEIAIRHIGTRALPSLLFWITRRDSSATKTLLANWPGVGQLRGPAANDYHARTTYACGVLKDIAKPIVPNLIKLLKDTDPDIRSSAAYALCQIGPAAEQAMPQLIESLDDPAAQANALAALRSIDGRPEVMVQILSPYLSRPNMQGWAMANLAAYGTNARSTVPKISELLQSRQWSLRNAATNSFKQIDSEPAARAGLK